MTQAIMPLMPYFVISLILIVILVIYYFLLKNKKTDITKTYANYLLTTSDPDVAFTYRQLSNGTYENYYLNYDESNPDLLKKEINDYPVLGTGEKFEPKEHGTIIKTDNGFRVSGVDTVFECPENWHWDENIKSCKLEPICKDGDVGNLKGLTQYYFNLNSVKSKIPLEFFNRKTTDSSVKYHDRLYVNCLNSNDFVVESCDLNKLFNQKEIQPSNIDPCDLYDICVDLREFTIHKYDIGNGAVLDDNQYYMCVNSKSEIRECQENSVFNVQNNGCIENNKCALKEDNFTFYEDDQHYTLCINGQERSIQCLNGVYEGHGREHLECVTDTTLKVESYFINDYISMPISLYTYKNNVQELNYATPGTIIKHIKLKQDASGFYKLIHRNNELFPPVEFNEYFIEYVDENTLEESVSVKLDGENYKKYQRNPYIQTNYYNSMLDDFNWNVLEDRPEFLSDTTTFYKYDTKIKHKTDPSFERDSVNYFYFITADKLYSPKQELIFKKSDDAYSGLLNFVDLLYPNNTLNVDTTFSPAFKILSWAKIDKVIILYYVNCFDGNVCAIAINEELIAWDSFDLVGMSLVSKFYNYPEQTVPDVKSFCIRLTSIMWSGFSLNSRYVLPEIFSILQISSIPQLEKQFTLLRTEPLTNNTDFDEYRNSIESSYVPGEFTGTTSEIQHILDQIYSNLLNVEV
ncbi:Vp91 [Callinectes sapidus nudivirus]|nr:Vp91 [Callinectes sapidus nudivirus]